jgi:hypothetical protein
MGEACSPGPGVGASGRGLGGGLRRCRAVAGTGIAEPVAQGVGVAPLPVGEAVL